MIRDFKVLIPVDYGIFDELVGFYAEVFGVINKEHGTSEIGNPWCSLEIAGTIVMVHSARDGHFPYPEFQPTGHGIALEFEVEDLAEVTRRLELRNYPINNRWQYSDGSLAVSVADPAGNMISLWQDAG